MYNESHNELSVFYKDNYTLCYYRIATAAEPNALPELVFESAHYDDRLGSFKKSGGSSQLIFQVAMHFYQKWAVTQQFLWELPGSNSASQENVVSRFDNKFEQEKAYYESAIWFQVAEDIFVVEQDQSLFRVTSSEQRNELLIKAYAN
jgi:hypothetical protein